MTDATTPSGRVSRRRWVMVAAGALAAGAGAAVAWRRLGSAPPDPAVEAFWGLRFERPEGGQLELATLRGRPLLLNFWATWCPPCLKEMPLLDRFHREQGWQVVGLAVDQAAPVRTYLQRLPMAFPIALAGMEGVGLSRDLGNAGGQLPFTAVFDSTGQVVNRHLGTVDEARLARWQGTIR